MTAEYEHDIAIEKACIMLQKMKAWRLVSSSKSLFFCVLISPCFPQIAMAQKDGITGDEILRNAVVAPPASMRIFETRLFGAVAAGKVDYAPAIGRAMQAAKTAGGGVVRLPKGEIWVALDASGNAITVPSGIFLDMRGTVLRLIENDRSGYNIILFKDRNAPSGVIGGTIIGDRDSHLGKDGEWGMCIAVRGGANVSIKGTKASKCWGDGIYLGAALSGDPSTFADNVEIDGVEAAYNRRNNISVVNARGYRICNVYVHHANGTLPESGIGIEPDKGGLASEGLLCNILSEFNGKRGLMTGGGKDQKIRGLKLQQITSRSNNAAGFWIEGGQDIKATTLSAYNNAEEGAVFNLTSDAIVNKYEGTGNGQRAKSGQGEISVNDSNRISFGRVSSLAGNRAQFKFPVIAVKKSMGVTVSKFVLNSDHVLQNSVFVDSTSDAILESMTFKKRE
ncbi:hypothetical protein SAMN04515617_10632 [Collimonas sp. OK242]|jgi:polygalacturonase|uniref:hypothetical protein n=1 Tax=Collimonas sp. OK242 TaxID=1798195 RepID=UPI000895A9AD|nr:hypothetical protein [Collimonas sp. OK242]SDX70789.1 hypothetical protein SAMN04515617_10632 [Collimonas sp. OK242]